MANLFGNIVAGAVAGGAKENIQTLREEAEQKRRESYAKLLNEFGRDNIKLSNYLSMKRDEVNRTNTNEDEFGRYVRDRSAKAADYQTERADKISDEDRNFSREKGLIGYRAGVSKANSIVGYSEDGTPLTFADVKPGMTVYADAVGREKISKKTIEEQQWELLSPEEKKMSARGLINKGNNVEVKPAAALSKIASIDKAIGELKKGNKLSSEAIQNMIEKDPILAQFLDTKAEMSQQDKDRAIKSLETERSYLLRFTPEQESGIINPQVDEVGNDIKNLLGQ